MPVDVSPTEWYYYIVVFIESRSFTRRLAELAGGLADDVLRESKTIYSEIPREGKSLGD
jgi:hypothetical protein